MNVESESQSFLLTRNDNTTDSAGVEDTAARSLGSSAHMIGCVENHQAATVGSHKCVCACESVCVA